MDHLHGHPIISDQVNKVELAVILRELQQVLNQKIEGNVVELGCHVGATSLFLQRTLANTGKTLHVYDSFEGLPVKTAADESLLGAQYKQGELTATKAEFIKHFKQAGLPLPVIHKGWFKDLKPKDLPGKICFAYLDGDFYESIRDSLGVVWPKLAPGAVIIVDDYQHEALPGARRAVDQWLQGHTATLRAEQSLAIIRLR